MDVSEFFCTFAPKDKKPTDMKRILITSFVWVVSLMISVAAPVNEQTAKKTAQDFIKRQMPTLTRGEAVELTRAITGIADGDDAGIYVFNSQKGFVVISANDELPAVLAYSNGDIYNAQTAPPAMKEMLEAYHYAATATTITRTSVPTHANISPLIKTTWDQNAPYNLQTPKGSSVEHCPTGCLATALAQIMYYHQYPNYFEWSKMKTSYKSTDTGDEANAVAKLMADVGEKIFMDYGDSESSARFIDACEALRYDYGYSETTEFVERSCYTAQSWDELLYDELAANRPVFMGAQSMSSTGQGGHAFVIDGYEVKNGTGYFHVNWGWGGSSDDYFLISVLNPKYQYTGGHAGSSGYSYSQNAIIGAQPAAKPMEKNTRFHTSFCYIVDDKHTYTRSSSSEDFPKLKLKFSLFNNALPKESRYYECAIAIYKGSELIQILHEKSIKDLNNGNPLDYGRGGQLQVDGITLGKNLSNGIYQIRILSREEGKSDWAWAIEAACRYIEFTINDNTMTTATFGNKEEYESDSDFIINSVDVSGSMKVGEPLTITINVTNNHMPNNAPIFLWGNASISEGANSFQCLGGGGTNLSPGETGDLVLEYTPQRSGDFKFILCGSSSNCNTPLSTFDVSVSGMYFIMELAVENSKPQSDQTNKVDGTTLEGTVKLSNYGSEAYNNNVYVRLYGLDDKDHNKNVSNPAQIAIGETVDIPFSFENLIPNNRYILLITVMDGENKKPLNYIINDNNTFTYYFKYVYQMTAGTGVDILKVDSVDPDVYNMQGVLLGKASELKTLPKGVYIINKKKIINR